MLVNNFNNDVYEPLVKEILNDAFYNNEISRRVKISILRQYTEIVVKKILDFPKDKYFTLGGKSTVAKIKAKNDARLETSIDTINKYGSNNTHTECLDLPTDADVDVVVDSLFYLYSYLLIDFFERYEFGLNKSILYSFSLLPPIIRYTTLKSLYDKYPDNIVIIDKLSLAILKAFDTKEALDWIEERKECLINLPSVTEEAALNAIKKCGEALVHEIIQNSPNMYELCIDKINIVGNSIEQNGKMYLTFEAAIDYYNTNGAIKGTSSEEKEFNSIMQFLYLGRKSNNA